MTSVATAKSSRPRGPRAGGRNGFQQQRKEQTRTAILTGAASVFSVTPYLFATIDDLIAAAGVSRATFYTHFDSKLSIALAIYDSIESDWQGLYDELTRMPRPDRAGLEDWLGRLAHLYVEHGFVTSLVIQLATFEPGFKQRLRDDGDRLIDMLGQAGVGGFRNACPRENTLPRKTERVRARLILTRIDQICSELAIGNILSAEERSLYIKVGAEDLLRFMEAADIKPGP